MLYSLGVFWSVAVKAVLNSEIHTIDIFLLYLINNATMVRLIFLILDSRKFKHDEVQTHS